MALNRRRGRQQRPIDPRGRDSGGEGLTGQHRHGNAGDFWPIGSKIEATGENKGIRWHRIADPKEKPLGEWNTMTVGFRKIVLHGK